MITLKTFTDITFLLLFFTGLLFFNTNNYCQAENALFDHLTVEDGLSNSLIFDMTQDSLGFIWIATQDGLNRYDGYSFKVFRSEDSSKIVSDNWISCVKTDRSGSIWYGTRTSGVGKIDLSSGKHISFREKLLSEFGEDALNVQNLFIMRDEKILIGTWGAGLLIFDPANNKFQQFKNQKENKRQCNRSESY